MCLDLEEAVSDLFKIFKDLKQRIKGYYDKFKEEPVKVVTSIWTSNRKITKLINFALILDAGVHFNFDKSRLWIFEDYLSKFLILIKLRIMLFSIEFRIILIENIKCMIWNILWDLHVWSFMKAMNILIFIWSIVVRLPIKGS